MIDDFPFDEVYETAVQTHKAKLLAWENQSNREDALVLEVAKRIYDQDKDIDSVSDKISQVMKSYVTLGLFPDSHNFQFRVYETRGLFEDKKDWDNRKHKPEAASVYKIFWHYKLEGKTHTTHVDGPVYKVEK